MVTLRPCTIDQARDTDGDWAELIGETVRVIALGVLAIVTVWPIVLPQAVASEVEHLTLLALVLGVAAVSSYFLARRFSRLAAGLLMAGLLAGAVLGIGLYPHLGLTASLPLITVVVGVLLNWRWALGFAGASSLAVAGIVSPGWLKGSEALQSSLASTLCFIWVSAAISWVITRPMLTALNWSWNSYIQARDLALRLREHQIQLGRVSKSLAETCLRLEQINRELERARGAAEEARRQKSEFAAYISHELRTPLNLVIGFSEMMVLSPEIYQDETLPAGYRGDVEAIYRNACHLSGLIDDVLDLSQVEAHRLALKRGWASLEEIAAEAVSTISSMFRDKRLSLEVRLAPDLPPLFVDRVRVREVLINLLNNAIRFTLEGGVQIRAQIREPDVVVTVEDSGVGIPAAELSTIFQEFRQVDGPERRRAGGSGLGLMICRRFIELHGGVMWAESSVGQGSKFHFTLPICHNVASTPIRESWQTWARAGGSESSPQTVLVVDEVGDALPLFDRYLDGYRVVGVQGFHEVIDSRPSPGIRAVIIATQSGRDDLPSQPTDKMARFTGFSDRPTVHCSIRTRRNAASDLGVADYLVKPVKRDQIESMLARLSRPPRQILVVDDDPDTVRLLMGMLTAVSAHCVVRRAMGGSDALKQLRASPPDLVLLDLLMPGLDGYDVLREMRGDPQLSRVPVVVVSAWEREDERVATQSITLAQAEGFPVGVTMRCVKASLDIMLGGDSDASASPAAQRG